MFILREVMIGLYQHQSSALQICSLALLALVLGAVRTLAIVYSPMKRKMVDSLRLTESLRRRNGMTESNHNLAV